MPSLEWVDGVVGAQDLRWDTRLVVGTTHCRVHATGPRFCVHLVWESSTNDEVAAALRAGLHPARECRLVEMGPMRVRAFVARGPLCDV